MNKYYVYLHRKAITNEIFYVGKGSTTRAWSRYGRNELWKRIANKYGFTVEILYDNLTSEQSFSIEKELVDWYGRIDLKTGCLANMSSGGDGPSLLAPEVVKRISKSLSGLKCYKADQNIYTFYNKDTEETFIGKRIELQDKYNIRIGNLFAAHKGGIVKGWIVKEHHTEDSLHKLLTRTSAGLGNANSDKNEYLFENVNTGETFIGTRVDFKKSYPNIKINIVFSSKTSSRAHKGWTVPAFYSVEDINKDTNGKNSPRADLAVYRFIHKDGRELIGTRWDMREIHNFNPYHLFCNNPAKTSHGWRLDKSYNQLS